MLHYLFKYSRSLFIICVCGWKHITQILFKGKTLCPAVGNAVSRQSQVPAPSRSAGESGFFPDHTLPRAAHTQKLSKARVLMLGHFVPKWAILLYPHYFRILHPNSISRSASGKWQLVTKTETLYMRTELFSMLSQINEYHFSNCKPTRSFLISQTHAIFYVISVNILHFESFSEQNCWRIVEINGDLIPVLRDILPL